MVSKFVAPSNYSSNLSDIVRGVQSSYSVDVVLAKEMLKLSVHTRGEVEEEIHGVNCRAIEESDELVRLALTEFDLQLNERKASFFPPKPVLRNVALTTGNRPLQNHERICYLNHPVIRIRFLRCELFRIEDAVQKFINFFELMYDVFGEFVAEREPLIADFTPTEEKVLRKSRNQFLPFRDRSGRQVFVGVGNCNQHIELKLRCKIFMYLLWSVTEDVETQRNGITIVAWLFDEADDQTWENHLFYKFDEEMLEYQKRQNASFPVRIASWQHFYMDTAYFRFFYKLYMFCHDKRYVSVHKAHFGTQTELRYKLASYGISDDMLPLTHKGILKFEHHHDFLDMQKAKLTSNRNHPNYREIVVCPRSNDIVFRKGTAFKYNKGNDFYRQLIRERSLDHFNANRVERQEITLSIVRDVGRLDGRFLEWNKKDRRWLVLETCEDIRKKISASFKQYNRYKDKDRCQLVKAIQSAIAIDKGDSDESNFCGPRTAYERENEYAFIEKSAKRLKTCTNDGDSDSNQCFGMSFAPT